MTMTKADIVERIYERVGFSKKEATRKASSTAAAASAPCGRRRLHGYRRPGAW